MGRKSSLDERAVFGAVAQELATSGHCTIDAVKMTTGLSVGSIYHRFASREGLLAETWLDAVGRFQAQFIAALEPGTLEAGVRAALVTPRFCRANPHEAIILACCRQAEFLTSETPAPLRNRIAAINATVASAVRRFATSTGRPLQACRLALVGYPLGAVGLYLPHAPVPLQLDKELAKAVRAALG